MKQASGGGLTHFPWLVSLVIALDLLLLWMPPGLSMLDARLYYSADEALVFLDKLGPVGRTEYFVHECVDLVFIATYTELFRQLARRWRLHLPPLLLFAPGAADLMETTGILVLLGMGTPRSRLLAVVIGYATCFKWLAFLAVTVTLAIGLRRRPRPQK